MIFKKETMSWNWTGWATTDNAHQAQDLYNYLHQYDSRFTLDSSGEAVDFDGKFKIKMLGTWNYRPHWVLECSDENNTVYDTQPSQPSRGYWFENGCKPLKVIFLDTDDFIYLIAWPNDSDISANCIGFVYIKTSDGKHYAQTLNPGTPTIDGQSYYNVITASPTPFSLSPFINFAAPAEEIYTTDKCLLLSVANGEASPKPTLKSCSTITFNQVITIDGKNYFTAGNHTLVPLDD